MNLPLTTLAIPRIRELLVSGQVSATEIVREYLSRIQRLDPLLNAFITVTEDYAFRCAQQIDQKISDHQPVGLLAGSVMAVKDVYLTEGIQTTAGSKVLQGFIPPYSSTVYRRLLEQDAIVIGKTNTDCFAFGVSTENSGYFVTKNPWDLSLIPGGSSGGSAAAQAASLCTFALGTDTGGSIRQPASLCGITGIKPTYGRNSRYGITAMASSFDCPGTFAKNVSDASLITQIMAGVDSQDATSSTEPVPEYLSPARTVSLKGLRIGIPKEYFDAAIDPEVKAAVLAAATRLESEGASLISVSLPNTALGLAVYYVLVPSEISANMARYDGIRFGQSKKDAVDLLSHYQETRGEFMEPELKRRILIGTYALSAGYFDAYYLKASQVRTLIKDEFQNAFTQVDLILAPVSPTVAWPIGQKANDPLQMYLADVYTCCINVAGLPALALPGGFNSNNLPIGFQLIGNYFEEAKLFSVGHQFQQLTDYHLKVPSL
ncbi:MAG: Asp-tRNA(Asn)/Glu-tRNA(Gln) amidotransferase subunit GatA [Candidatus Shapirobacteria bacterium]|jgi:aspartyl-tRNA(Asn)/glutamyl-tRNA(Gln) amidotransferase subunit A